jgi:hypothetical protein
MFPTPRYSLPREHFNGMYRVDTYFLSRQLVEFPFSSLFATVFLTIVYLMVGLHLQLDKFLVALLTILLVVQVAISLGGYNKLTLHQVPPSH